MSFIMPKPIDNVNQNAGSAGETVSELVHSVMHRLRTQQFQALRLTGHDFTQMEARVLGYFDRHAGATQSDLAAHSGRDKAQLARLIKGLRGRGLLSGEADRNDKRHLRLSLTPAGLAQQQVLAQQALRLGAQAVAGLSADELAQLQALLQRVRGNLTDVEGE